MKKRIILCSITCFFFNIMNIQFMMAVDKSSTTKNKKTFEIQDPDYEKSPYTGMTRKHWIGAATYILDGAFGYISDLESPMKFPKQFDKTYPKDESQVPTEKLEGLCRTLFVAAPLLKENPDLELNGIKVLDYYHNQILNLTNPKKENYIKHRGNGGLSQILVEFGALAISLSAAPEVLWNTFNQEQKDSIATMMLSYGNGPTINSNWRFFNIFILSFFKDQGYKVNDALLEKYITECLAAYRGQGWYNDSPAYDYYSMWAFQLYGALWAQLYGNKFYPGYASCFIANLNEMAANYPYMFSKEGKMNMWGRSIPYRFGAVAPLAMLGYTEDPNINYGWLRHISSATLLQFIQHPDFMEDNVPTLGFYGPFEPSVQIYSCRGSVYWSGKAFLALLLPENNIFWNSKENNDPWEKTFQKDTVYNIFQKRSNLLITNYPNLGGSEMRSWCHEKVADDWQKFRSTENYNKLAYNTEFPWMADGKNGEISMNYGILNKNKEWEVLRLYTFQDFQNGIYRRDAILETNPDIKLQLADVPLSNGILRVDKVLSPIETPIRLGHYSLPSKDSPITENTQKIGKHKANIIGNGEYQLAMIPFEGWDNIEVIHPEGLHPESSKCGLIIGTSIQPANVKTYITLQLWKKGNEPFTEGELSPVKEIKKIQANIIEVTLNNGEKKTIHF